MQDTIQRETHFWERGCQYYIAARFAVPGGLNPVAANLLHHAIEFMLKGTLVKTRELRGLQNKYGHKLPPLWKDFKTVVGDAGLTRFDAIIDGLHRYEDLRYPDDALKNGMESVITSHRGMADLQMMREGILPAGVAADINRRIDALPKGKRYDLCLEEVDELVEAIFKAAKWDPRFFFSRMNPKARETLADGNQAKGLLK
ncbi:hypothetical protein SAMN05443247_08143 [Bradyrhizobium erythrophlei]|jgi:hypothetical protein|nr:hypothetical protein SAMN05443247_08143 [Bradyrhizobium erythrophlei]